jgi:hypothetical protein
MASLDGRVGAVASQAPTTERPAPARIPRGFAQRGIGVRLGLALAATTLLWADVLWFVR